MARFPVSTGKGRVSKVTFLTAKRPRSVIELLEGLIRIPSINPAFSGHRADWAGEARVSDYLLNLARQSGLKVKLQSVEGRRKNLWVTLPARGRRTQRIILAPHLDTVGVEDSAQLRSKLLNGRLYGRGACDTKGSVAAMFFSLLELARRSVRPEHTEILFVGLVDEENAQLGSRAFAAKCPDADLAIIGEPTRLKVVTAHKGDFWLQIETRGKAAHGSRPDLGRNAVLEMAKLVLALETEYAEELKTRRHPLLGHATINVGVIVGGKQPNMVPDGCRIHVDRRSLPGESLSDVQAELRRVARTVGVKIEIVDLRQRPTLALETDSSLPQVQNFIRQTGQKSVQGADFFCDAAIIGMAGVPCVVYGPGDIAQAHTRDEWISVKSLKLGTQRLLRYLSSLP
ncbi:MAG: Acetylornithine deacetylase [Verrucomicrobia subdivision 3 bacterium]|nr:Acetylornithine deacetylase [Limisphaerales bacterium]MCS1417137.1 Acetylornithine deacetylase [Limisphaerales bacterium]